MKPCLICNTNSSCECKKAVNPFLSLLQETSWSPLILQVTSENPDLGLPIEDQSLNTLIKVTYKIIKKFGQLIEYNGLNRFLFQDNGEPKKEPAAQLLFYAVANIYCENNGLTISRESNAGRGPVDFKIANGSTNIIVDLKLSSNVRLEHAYKIQIPTYQKAEGSSHAIILILKVKERSRSLENLLKRKNIDRKEGKHTPEIACFDATIKPSASKA